MQDFGNGGVLHLVLIVQATAEEVHRVYYETKSRLFGLVPLGALTGSRRAMPHANTPDIF